jgi:hypothetical protein
MSTANRPAAAKERAPSKPVTASDRVIVKDNSPRAIFFRGSVTVVGSAVIAGAAGNWFAGPFGLFAGMILGAAIGYGVSKAEAGQR